MDTTENPYATSQEHVAEDVDADRPSLAVLVFIRAVSITIGGLTLVITLELALAVFGFLSSLQLVSVLGMGSIAAFVFGIGTDRFLLQIFRDPIPDNEFFGVSTTDVSGYDRSPG